MITKGWLLSNICLLTNKQRIRRQVKDQEKVGGGQLEITKANCEKGGRNLQKKRFWGGSPPFFSEKILNINNLDIGD